MHNTIRVFALIAISILARAQLCAPDASGSFCYGGCCISCTFISCDDGSGCTACLTVCQRGAWTAEDDCF